MVSSMDGASAAGGLPATDATGSRHDDGMYAN